MSGVFFQDRSGRVARSPYRTDVALFVGFVDRRRRRHLPGAVPTGTPSDDELVHPVMAPGDRRDRRVGEPELYRWLVTEGWARGDDRFDRAAGLDELLHVPVP